MSGSQLELFERDADNSVGAGGPSGEERVVLKLGSSASNPGGPSVSRESMLARACSAVLLYHEGGVWNDSMTARWEDLTGTKEATTKNLCDFVRKAMQHG